MQRIKINLKSGYNQEKSFVLPPGAETLELLAFLASATEVTVRRTGDYKVAGDNYHVLSPGEGISVQVIDAANVISLKEFHQKNLELIADYEKQEAEKNRKAVEDAQAKLDEETKNNKLLMQSSGDAQALYDHVHSLDSKTQQLLSRQGSEMVENLAKKTDAEMLANLSKPKSVKDHVLIALRGSGPLTRMQIQSELLQQAAGVSTYNVKEFCEMAIKELLAEGKIVTYGEDEGAEQSFDIVKEK